MRTILIMFICLAVCGCVSTTDMDVIRSFNERISALEKKADTVPPAVQRRMEVYGETNMPNKVNSGQLTPSQKEFIKLIFEHLNDNNVSIKSNNTMVDPWK